MLTGIFLNLGSLGSVTAFLLSLLAIMSVAAALRIKNAALKRTGPLKLARFIAAGCALIALSPAVVAFPHIWSEASGLLPKALLLWIALLSWMLICVVGTA